ncbi:hypothetical protein [Aureivirga sp. CE67]|uniref:hypothetical protein n=1 Tax=Aureivirga sp. CE67 TaxID=1788983 RepID=UPI0018C97D3B|nr:hypothetical protein [Aureivirga sp. CE67]
MKKTLLFIAFIISTYSFSQINIELRDLSFKTPKEFKYSLVDNRHLDYDLFYELGKIFTDSTSLGNFPKIQYQYYEVPYPEEVDSKKTLERLNKIMTKDFPADSLFINNEKNYSLAKYTINNKSVFEIKNLGKNGWFNIQYFDFHENDVKSYQNITYLINSIQHHQAYKNKSSEINFLNKSGTIFLFIALFIFFLPKLITKLKNVV